MNNKAKVQHWDDMYDMPLENIPWEIKEPPKDLVDLINKGVLTGSKALDIACGTGNYTFLSLSRARLAEMAVRYGLRPPSDWH